MGLDKCFLLMLRKDSETESVYVVFYPLVNFCYRKAYNIIVVTFYAFNVFCEGSLDSVGAGLIHRF